MSESGKLCAICTGEALKTAERLKPLGGEFLVEHCGARILVGEIGPVLAIFPGGDCQEVRAPAAWQPCPKCHKRIEKRARQGDGIFAHACTHLGAVRAVHVTAWAGGRQWFYVPCETGAQP